MNFQTNGGQNSTNRLLPKVKRHRYSQQTHSIVADHEVPALKKQEIVDLVNDLVVSQDDTP